ncbi:unnamed protein product [Citrullus colocynthis]|uniref:Uncharacterized protein n=1 Tax=Citrullus colocynthis TaxID=252529 RepID=A0ABP0YWX6_9ROSI
MGNASEDRHRWRHSGSLRWMEAAAEGFLRVVRRIRSRIRVFACTGQVEHKPLSPTTQEATLERLKLQKKGEDTLRVGMTKQGRWLQLGRGKVDQLGADMWLGGEKVKTWICLSVEHLTKSAEAPCLK